MSSADALHSAVRQTLMAAMATNDPARLRKAIGDFAKISGHQHLFYQARRLLRFVTDGQGQWQSAPSPNNTVLAYYRVSTWSCLVADSAIVATVLLIHLQKTHKRPKWSEGGCHVSCFVNVRFRRLLVRVLSWRHHKLDVELDWPRRLNTRNARDALQLVNHKDTFGETRSENVVMNMAHIWPTRN